MKKEPTKSQKEVAVVNKRAWKKWEKVLLLRVAVVSEFVRGSCCRYELLSLELPAKIWNVCKNTTPRDRKLGMRKLIFTNRLTTIKLKSRPFPQPPSLKHQWEGEKTYAKECKLDRYLSLTHLHPDDPVLNISDGVDCHTAELETQSWPGNSFALCQLLLLLLFFSFLPNSTRIHIDNSAGAYIILCQSPYSLEHRPTNRKEEGRRSWWKQQHISTFESWFSVPLCFTLTWPA